MRRHDDGRPAGVDFTEQVHDFERQVGIEIAGWFVRENDGGIVDQRTRDGNALLLAAGQLEWIGIHPVLKPHPFQDLEGPPLLLRLRHAEHARHERDVFQHGFRRQELEVLKHETERAAITLDLTRRERGQISAADHQLPLGRHVLTEEKAQERGLARTAWSGQEDEVTFFHTERQVAERVHAARIRLRDVVRLDHAGSLSSSRRTSALTSAGFALPPIDLMTCPTRNP